MSFVRASSSPASMCIALVAGFFVVFAYAVVKTPKVNARAVGQVGNDRRVAVSSDRATDSPVDRANTKAGTDLTAPSDRNIDGIAAGAALDAPVDFNGDGRSDYVVVRNEGGGPSGQIAWYSIFSSGGGFNVTNWGIGSDHFISEDFDNDNKDDIAVWRSGVAGSAAFYILNSATATARIEAFGQTGDDPTVVDDYNNDGSADLAVYRNGISAGAQSVWYYRTTPGGPVNFVPWGITDDVPSPGDYDGDGSADFVVQRADMGGTGTFWRRMATGAFDAFQFGLGTDLVVPGDYDGDGKTDVGIARFSSGSLIWFWEPSASPGVSAAQATFGSTGDIPVPGLFDADAKTDLAIWRNGTYWIFNTQTSSISTFNFGLPTDYPVGNFFVH